MYISTSKQNNVCAQEALMFVQILIEDKPKFDICTTHDIINTYNISTKLLICNNTVYCVSAFETGF